MACCEVAYAGFLHQGNLLHIGVLHFALLQANNHCFCTMHGCAVCLHGWLVCLPLQASEVCMQTPACYESALSDHIVFMSSEEEVLQLLQREPDSVDAVVVFPLAATTADNSTAADSFASSSHSTGINRAKMLHSDSDSDDSLLLDYVIRMNSSDVPPTQLLLDMWDVSPGIMPVPGNLLW